MCLLSGAFPLLQNACGPAIGEDLHQIASKVSKLQLIWAQTKMICWMIQWLWSENQCCHGWPNAAAPLLGQCWLNVGPMLAQCRANAGPVSGRCWPSVGPMLAQCRANAGPVLDPFCSSRGPMLDQCRPIVAILWLHCIGTSNSKWCEGTASKRQMNESVNHMN